MEYKTEKVKQSNRKMQKQIVEIWMKSSDYEDFKRRLYDSSEIELSNKDKLALYLHYQKKTRPVVYYLSLLSFELLLTAIIFVVCVVVYTKFGHIPLITDANHSLFVMLGIDLFMMIGIVMFMAVSSIVSMIFESEIVRDIKWHEDNCPLDY